MQLNKVTRKVRLDSTLTAIKYQLITELMFLRRQALIESDLTYLALLTLIGPVPLKEFCIKAVAYLYGDDILQDVHKYPVRVQTVRNRLGLLEKRGFIVKQGKGKKTLMLNPAIPITKEGNILLEYNFIYVETQESKGLNTAASEPVANL